MDVVTAIGAAKRCRSIIDPIGQLPEFLKRLKKAYDSHPDVSGSKYPPVAPGSTAATNDSDK